MSEADDLILSAIETHVKEVRTRMDLIRDLAEKLDCAIVLDITGTGDGLAYGSQEGDVGWHASYWCMYGPKKYWNEKDGWQDDSNR